MVTRRQSSITERWSSDRGRPLLDDGSRARSDRKLVEEWSQETKVEKRRNFIITCEKVKIEIHSFKINKIPHKNT